MSRHPFAIADVFTDRPLAGNQLAVVLEADGLPSGRMQAVAREFGFSETTFVRRAESPGRDVRVRIFTPATEIPFAGHPTVGTALVLAWRGLLAADAGAVVLGEGAGPVRVELRRDAAGQAVAAELTAPGRPEIGPAADAARVAAALGLEPVDLATADGLPREASCGLPFLLVELADRDALARARLRGTTGADLSPHAANGLYLFVREGDGGGDVRARLFGPAHGIPEDPATGSAAAALAGLLAAGSPRDGPAGDGWRSWTIAQGVEMGRPSRIEARARVEGGRVAEVRVGGAAVPFAEGYLDA